MTSMTDETSGISEKVLLCWIVPICMGTNCDRSALRIQHNVSIFVLEKYSFRNDDFFTGPEMSPCHWMCRFQMVPPVLRILPVFSIWKASVLKPQFRYAVDEQTCWSMAASALWYYLWIHRCIVSSGTPILFISYYIIIKIITRQLS